MKRKIKPEHKLVTHILKDSVSGLPIRPEIASDPMFRRQEKCDEAANYIYTALYVLGMPMDNENFRDTHTRFTKYLQEFLTGAGETTKDLLKTGFTASKHEYKGMVAQFNIPFRTICPHHLLPVIGRAHVGYVPNARVVGLSKLARLVIGVGKELPRMQEDLTDRIADIMQEGLEAKGVIVVISATHMCMEGRGVSVQGVPTSTSTIRGVFRDVPSAREEFFRLLETNHINGLVK